MSSTKKIAQAWITNWFFGFSQIPTNEDSCIYMKAVLCCAKADGDLSPEERDWALGFSACTGVDDWVIEELKVYQANEPIEEVLARSPQVSAAKRDIILSAIWVCAADGEYHDAEKKKIRQMASILGLSEVVVEQLEKHYQKEAALQRDRIKLLYPEKSPY